MRSRTLLVAATLLLALGQAPTPVQAQSAAPAALTGKVSSAAESAMEGVVVSAKKGIVTVSVVSNDKGEFSFPASKLGAGDYALSIRATGYNLEGPKTVTLAGDKPANIDVKLVKTRNLASQLTNLEWMLSVPGTDDQKKALTGCTNCHSVERILNSAYNADEMYDVIKRMAQYSNNSFYKKPQIRAEVRDINRFVPNAEKVAAYFASINRSEGERSWELKTLPRVSGAGTKVIITEYDLPEQTIQPHDVMVDADGIVWHSDFSGQMLGRLDTKTLQHKAYSVPVQRQGWPTGALDLESDPQGNLWLGLMFQHGAAKFDRKTEQFQMIRLPDDMLKADSQQAMVGPQNWTVDNKLWMQDPARRGLYRVDLTSGKTELFEPFKNRPGSPYSIFSDKENNIWFLDFGGENIGKIDAKTTQLTLYPTPTKRSRPRRGRIDDEGRIWFAEFGGERIGMFDTKSEKFKEWEVPGRFFAPYDAALDKNGNLWTGGMNADRILRLNTETGKFTEYQLPHYTNVRRVFVDNHTTPPTFWVGNNHGAALIKIEPQD
jgi:virginiamycin B lyase